MLAAGNFSSVTVLYDGCTPSAVRVGEEKNDVFQKDTSYVFYMSQSKMVGIP